MKQTASCISPVHFAGTELVRPQDKSEEQMQAYIVSGDACLVPMSQSRALFRSLDVAGTDPGKTSRQWDLVLLNPLQSYLAILDAKFPPILIGLDGGEQ